MIKNRKKRLLGKVCLCILLCFIGFNVLVFSGVIRHHVDKGPYHRATAYMAASFGVNFFYIYPLSRTFGYKNFLTKPFYFFRDSLYEKGYALFPEDAAEKEMWWFLIRHSEFNEFVSDDVLTYYHGNAKNLDELMAWSDEIYVHLSPLATNSLENDYFKKFRFQTYITTAYWYIRAREKLLSDITNKKLYPFKGKKEEAERMQNILEWLDVLIDYAKYNEPKVYESCAKRIDPVWFRENDLRLEASMHLVYYALYENQLDCNDPYLKMFLTSRAIMLTTENDPVISLKSKKIISASLTEGRYGYFYRTIQKWCEAI